MRMSAARAVVMAAVLCWLPMRSLAVSTGIASPTFGATGCPLCHFGGAVPGVVLAGPEFATPGHTYQLTLTIFGDPLQSHGGLNISASDGVLALGGPFATDTRTIVGAGGRTEITHSTPKAGDPLFHQVEFSFLWTAPPAFTSVTITGWGNAVNRNFGTSGDAAASDAISILTDDVTPTPTPTPLPAPCVTAAPLEPALLDDAPRQRCQAAVGKAGFLYLKQHLNAANTCLKSFRAGDLAGDPVALCIGSTGSAPTEARTAEKVARAEAKVRALLSAKCPDDVVAGLDLCAATEAGLEDCFLAAHRQRAVDGLAGANGLPTMPANPDTAKCQNDVAKAAARYVSTHQRAAQKCLDARNKRGTPLTGAGLECAGVVSGGMLVPPSNAKAARKVNAALDKLADRIQGSCTDGQIASLVLCGNSRAGLLTCLGCAQSTAVLGAIAEEYGGD